VHFDNTACVHWTVQLRFVSYVRKIFMKLISELRQKSWYSWDELTAQSGVNLINLFSPNSFKNPAPSARVFPLQFLLPKFKFWTEHFTARQCYIGLKILVKDKHSSFFVTAFTTKKKGFITMASGKVPNFWLKFYGVKEREREREREKELERDERD